MSVINQMLRDLENRKIKPVSSGHYVDEVNIIAPNSRNHWWLILPLLIVVVLSMTLYLHRLNQDMSADVVMVNQEAIQFVPKDTNILSDLPDQLSEIAPKPVKALMQTNDNTAVKVDGNLVTKNVNKSVNKAVNKNTVKNVQVIPEYSKPVPVKSMASKAAYPVIEQSSPQPVVTIKTITKSPEKSTDAATSVEKNIDVNSKIVIKSAVIEPSQDAASLRRELIQQARLLMSSDQQSAITLLEHNLRKISPDSDYFSLLANLYQRQGRFDEAIIFYKKALRMTPDKGELWIGIALAYQSTGETENSQMALKKAVNSDINPTLKQYAAQRILNQ